MELGQVAHLMIQWILAIDLFFGNGGLELLLKHG
jgi:hypothetical protein